MELSAHYELFESFADVPPAWQEICGGDVAMDRTILSICQRTLADQCRCWGLVIFDESGTAIGCAALVLFYTEMFHSSHPLILRWRARIRRLWPGFGILKVLFCGLPIPAGATHIRVRSGACEKTVLAQVEAAMQQLTRGTKCHLMVFKELEPASWLAGLLAAKGYASGAIPPLHLLTAAFKNFADYRGALKSRYRAQVQRSEKKLEAASFEVLTGCGTAFFNAHFDDRMHGLYVEMQQRADHKLELLPAAFFREMATALGDEILLTVIRRDNTACGFTFGLIRGQTYYNLYSGVDYALNHGGDLYFNLFYHSMDQAFRAGAASLHLGQTSDSFKSRLGTATKELRFFACTRSRLLTAILRLAMPWCAPAVAPVEPHHVFAN